jgi:phosphatidate phosphatase APP1
VVLASKPVPGSRADHAAKNGTQNVRGWRAFTSVPIAGSTVEIHVGGTVTKVRTDRGGLVDIDIQVSLSPGWHTAVLRAEGTEPAEASIFIIGPETKFGIVSDIDDTVMVTALPRPFLALWNTFVLNERARMATPGMAVLMDRLTIEHPDAPVIYLSTGPWNAAPTLARFLTRNMYPSGALVLTDWGLTQDRWFRSGQEHKRQNLERLAAEFPNMRWLLIGDNGQHDEQIYSAFSQKHADKVAAIAIRQLSVSESVFAGGHSETGDHSASSVTWIYSPDGAGIAKRLKQLELI